MKLTQMNWQRMNIVIDRYERLTSGQLRDLRKLQKMAMSPNTDSASIRNQIDQIGQQLESSLSQLLSERGNLEPAEQEHFDERTEQIRKQIQTAIRATKALPPLTSKNPFLEDDPEEFNPYEAESQRYVQESNARMLEMKAKAEEARMTAEATAKLNKDMRDLEEIFAELATIVHEQHEVVDSIEEHVERATHDIRHGNEQLKKAIRHKTNQTTVAAAVVGGLAVGGPVGVAAGSALAGIAAGIGGLVAGIYGGKWFRNTVRRDCDVNN
ncbi:SNARE domain protein [Teladorsagia circumcincta]|uniref:SNARE domain protein n=1 Tax=Teladorsagia circumcincta TaxID=45464 RepID=A0A2G9UMK5_TELCI|nr:SNARE domain protein [Teladorsagia circumcincta]